MHLQPGTYSPSPPVPAEVQDDSSPALHWALTLTGFPWAVCFLHSTWTENMEGGYPKGRGSIKTERQGLVFLVLRNDMVQEQSLEQAPQDLPGVLTVSTPRAAGGLLGPPP